MSNFYNRLAGLFKIDYQHRLKLSMEEEVFEAKKAYIEAAQKKQLYDVEVVYQANRLNMLVEMLAKLKGPEDEKTSSITSVSINSINVIATKQ